MKQDSEVNFKALFEAAPQLYLVLTPDLTIVAASQAYLRATMTVREEILGRKLFDVFPDNPADATATGNRNLNASLQIVLKDRVQHTMAVQKYDIRRSQSEGGDFEERYWSPVNSPVLDENGEVTYIIHRVEDVTDFVRLKQQGSEQSQLTEELRDRAGKMEREVFLRAQEIQERTRELEIVNRELQTARDQALDASRFKSEFLANMSHEIRTPMNGILGMTEIVLRGPLPPKLRDHVTVIRDAGRSLLSIINDILDFSKIEAGKLSLDLTEYEPVRLVESVGELLAEQARVKNLSLSTLIEADVPRMLRGDQVRLRQILLNLAGNAIKFSSHGEVRVRVALEQASSDAVTLRFSVSDQGLGLSKDEIDLLFQPFVQGDGSTTRKYGGTGLGLSISRRLVELMGGKIGVESKKGEGSLFWFRVQQQCCEMAECQQQIDLHGVKSLVVDDQFGVEQQYPSGSRMFKRQELILVVEDHLVNQQVALLLLHDLGFEAHVANSGKEALEVLSLAPYSLVLMDVQMPEMNGFETTRVVRMQEARTGKHLPIVAMTAHAIEGSSEACFAAGMDDYLSKPVDPEALKAIIDKWLPAGDPPCGTKSSVESAVVSQTDAPLNLAALRQRYCDERQKILLDMFLDSTSRELIEMEPASASGDRAEVRRLAHGMRGASCAVLAHGMTNILLLIETSAGQEDGDYTDLITRLVAEFQRLTEYLKQPSGTD